MERGSSLDTESHWERVYATKRADHVSWFRPHLETSLDLIRTYVPDRDARIIDVGGGESTLVDDLIIQGYRSVDVLDLSATALAVAKRRLGASAPVNWMHGDITKVDLGRHRYDHWHDRAVFHFLTDADNRLAYVHQAANTVKPGGHVIVATFGPEGPTKCSGLDVVRYDPQTLHDEFGKRFASIDHVTELHQTPAGAMQQFVYCCCAVS